MFKPANVSYSNMGGVMMKAWGAGGTYDQTASAN